MPLTSERPTIFPLPTKMKTMLVKAVTTMPITAKILNKIKRSSFSAELVGRNGIPKTKTKIKTKVYTKL